MTNRRFLTPAFVSSLVILLIAAVVLTTGPSVLGWIVFVLGLALNVVAVALYSNRDDLRRR